MPGPEERAASAAQEICLSWAACTNAPRADIAGSFYHAEAAECELREMLTTSHLDSPAPRRPVHVATGTDGGLPGIIARHHCQCTCAHASSLSSEPCHQAAATTACSLIIVALGPASLSDTLGPPFEKQRGVDKASASRSSPSQLQTPPHMSLSRRGGTHRRI